MTNISTHLRPMMMTNSPNDRCIDTREIRQAQLQLPDAPVLLFEEDLEQRGKITDLILRGQALLGMGKKEAALALLLQVQFLDQNHSGAIDLLRSGAK